MLSKKVDFVFLSFPLARPLPCDSDKCITVGNPVNPAFVGKIREEARNKLSLPLDAKIAVSYGDVYKRQI